MFLIPSFLLYFPFIFLSFFLPFPTLTLSFFCYVFHCSYFLPYLSSPSFLITYFISLLSSLPHSVRPSTLSLLVLLRFILPSRKYNDGKKLRYFRLRNFQLHLRLFLVSSFPPLSISSRSLDLLYFPIFALSSTFCPIYPSYPLLQLLNLNSTVHSPLYLFPHDLLVFFPFHDVVALTHTYKFPGPVSIPVLNRRHAAHPTVHPSLSSYSRPSI